MVKWIRFLQKPIAHNDGNVRFFGLLIHTPVCVYRCFSLGGGGGVGLGYIDPRLGLGYIDPRLTAHCLYRLNAT